jgi:hypothetical protein
MPAKRLSMRKIKEILRLKWECGLSNREISRSCSLGRTAVARYVHRARQAGLSWPLPEDMDEARLEHMLFPSVSGPARDSRPIPDWAYVHRELRRKG